MAKKVSNAEELSIAIKNEEDIIIVEGDLAKSVIRIKATGKMAWIICFSAIVACFGLTVTAPVHGTVTAGASAVITFGSAAPAVATLGIPATTVAISLAIASGGVGVLNKLRKYKIIKKDDNLVVLERN